MDQSREEGHPQMECYRNHSEGHPKWNAIETIFNGVDELAGTLFLFRQPSKRAKASGRADVSASGNPKHRPETPGGGGPRVQGLNH